MTRTLILRTLLTLSAVGVALGAGPAEARFGKKSTPEKVKQHKEQQQKKAQAQATPQHRHAASPVNPRPASSPTYGSGSACCDESYEQVYVQPAPVYVSSGYTYYSQPAQVYQPAPPDPDAYRVHHFEATASAQPLINGAVLGIGVRVDWKRWGLDARYDHVSLLAEDGSFTFDTIRLVDTALTYSLLSGEHGRLRAHLGLYSAFAPDVIFVGPGAGASVSLNLFGPFTAEAGANLVLIPFTKLDTHAALGFRVGILEARGGLRLTALDDQGRVDGVRNTDVLLGPYVSLGLVL